MDWSPKKCLKPSAGKELLPSTDLTKHGVSGNWKAFCNLEDRPVRITPHISCGSPRNIAKQTQKKSKKAKASRVVALDCEMVADKDGKDMLARVSVVDFSLNCVLDAYVKPTVTVGDYRTRFSGIRPKDLENAEEFRDVQLKVRQLLRDKILVGHNLRSDINVLGFGHHAKLTRDTSLFKLFRDISQGKTPSLKNLVKHFLGETIQTGEHSSVEDAAAAMKLYKKFRQSWEKSIREKIDSKPFAARLDRR